MVRGISDYNWRRMVYLSPGKKSIELMPVTAMEPATMGSTDRRGWLCTMLVPLVTLLVHLPFGTGFYYREYGVVKPDNPYLFVGEDLVLFCNLTKLELLEDSTYLYFTRSGVNIPSHYMDILTTRSVRLRYPIRQPQDEGHFVCWLRQELGRPRTIGSQHVKADYPVATVKGVNCTVYNWENMTCEWDLGQDYHHPEFIHVGLVWTISGIQKDCPKGHMTNTSCTWVRGGQDRFLPGHRYIMSVEVTNTQRRQTSRSQTFHVRTDTIVKPSPVAGLQRSEGNATCLWLTWDHSDKVHDKVAYVQYLSQWNSSHWHQLETIFFKQGPGQARICDLTPFTEYTIRVAVKPLPRGNMAPDGYRSEWKYIEKVRTDPSVPEVAPEMCIGCFTDVFCERPHCRNVIVYWKHIPWALRRSVIHSYQLLYIPVQQSTVAQASDDQSVNGKVSTLYPNTSHLLPIRNDSAYTVQLYAITSDHKVSRNHSSLLLVAKKDKPQGPTSLIVETDFKADGTWTGQFDLHWSDNAQSTASFLVAWCRGSTAVLKCHHEDQNQVQWQEISSNSRHFQITVSSQGAERRERADHYLVGVARQERRPDGSIISSGLTWAQCYFLKNAVPRALPENVDFSQVFQPGTLRVTWTYQACSSLASDVYITRFIIYYCVITDTANNRCKGSEHNTTAGRDAGTVLLEDLEQGAYYRVSMAADSEWGTGQRTQPVYSRVLAAQQQEEPRNFAVIGVILAVVIIIVLILIGLCKVRRRLQKNQEKFITSFGDLPSLPPDSAVKSFKDRPLPQVPEGTSSSTAVACTSNTGSAAGCDKRQRGGKHKSITSETSLLGHEDAGNDDDSKRRHKSGTASVSERSKLLEDEGGTQESCMTVSKYDSDSGADSRYSGEDHDYASVEGGNGSAEEGGDGGSKANAGGQFDQDGSMPDGEVLNETLWKQHKPAPTHSPPPPPPSVQSGYTPATLVPEETDDLNAASAVSSFKPQGDSRPALKTLNSLSRTPRAQNPAQLTVALEPVQALHTLNTLPTAYRHQASGYPGSEDVTLPRRLPGSRLKPAISGVQDTPFTSAVDPYASTRVASFSSHLPPPPAPPPYQAQPGKAGDVRDGQQARNVGPRGNIPQHTLNPIYPTPATTSNGSLSHNDVMRLGSADSRPPGADTGREADNLEPIYSPPWESNTLIPFAVDNRPLSEYMLKLPQNFFDSSLHVNEGPTTEL